MKALFSVFLNATFYGSVMILLALLLRPVLRNAPRRILCVLWLFVMVRLLLPISIESKLSLQPQVTPVQPLVEQLLETPSAPPIAEDPATPLPQVPSVPTDDIPAPQPALQLQDILPWIWLGIMGAIFVYMGISYGLLRHRIRESVPCEKGVWETNRIPGAFMLGYLWPQIYLPTGLAPTDRQLIIAHEKTHIRRGDVWWKLLGMLCLCLHWYNPLVWLAYALMSRDIEAACDELVIRTMPLEERKAYSYALVNVGKRMSGVFVSPMAFAEVNLKQRIKKVLSYRNPGIWISVSAVVICALIVIFFMTTPEPQNNIAQAPGSTEATESSTQTESTTETAHTHIWQPATCTAPKICTICNAAAGEKAEHTFVKRKCTACGTLLPTEDLRFTLNTDGKSYRCDNYSGSDPNVVIPASYNGLPVTQISRMSSILPVLVILPDTITVINDNAFGASCRLSSITLSSNLTTIGNGAFASCTSLETLTLPATVTSIGENAFMNCNQLKSIYFAGTIAQWNAIKKGENWIYVDANHGNGSEGTIPATYVTCSDGIVYF